jgi:hypothetical protein
MCCAARNSCPYASVKFANESVGVIATAWLRCRHRIAAWPTCDLAETEFAHNPGQAGNRIASMRV